MKIHVREYAKLANVSPPTASKTLELFYNEGLLRKEVDKLHHLYYANRASELFKDLQQTYWKLKLENLLSYVEENMLNPVIILFGSIAKAELKKTSDIDIAVFTPSRKEVPLKHFEKELGREIQLFIFSNLEEVPIKLKNNILNGKLLRGMW
jgi:predicted nucleotidyltransferase